MRQTTIQLKESQWDALKKRAEETGVSLGGHVRLAVEKYLQMEGVNNG